MRLLRETLLTAACAVVSVLLADAIVRLDGAIVVFKSQLYLFVGLPLLGLVAAAFAWVSPRHPWRWALIVALVQPLQPMLSAHMRADGQMSFLMLVGPCCFGAVFLVCLPFAVIAAIHSAESSPNGPTHSAFVCGQCGYSRRGGERRCPECGERFG